MPWLDEIDIVILRELLNLVFGKIIALIVSILAMRLPEWSCSALSMNGANLVSRRARARLDESKWLRLTASSPS
jgi:hypothetical protein